MGGLTLDANGTRSTVYLIKFLYALRWLWQNREELHSQSISGKLLAKFVYQIKSF
jgi:hypothetical protein